MEMGGGSWDLHAGKYALMVRVLFQREVDAPQNQ